MGLCSFMATRKTNKKEPKPAPPDLFAPDIIYDKGDFSVCKCNLGNSGMRWGVVPVTYWIDELSFGKFAKEIGSMASRAFFLWAQHSNLKVLRVRKAEDANIRIYMRRIDGIGRKLGVAYQPATTNPLMEESRQWKPPFVGDIVIDTGDSWNESSLFGVLLHEIGHALGVEHINDERTVMNPTYLGKKELHELDIAAIVGKYGSRENAFV